MTLRSSTLRLVASLLPLASLITVAACSSSTSDPEDTSDGPTVGGTQGTITVTSTVATSAVTTGGANNTTSAQAAGSSSNSSSGNGTTAAATTGGVANSTTGGPGGPVTVTASASTTGGTGGAGNVGTEGSTTASTTQGAGGNGAGGNGAANTTGTTGPTFHIFMLMGQSNMAGATPFNDGDKNTDERLKVWGGCNQPAGQWNTATPPLNDCPGEKGWNLSNSVDPGIWFGKTLLEVLPEGDTIGLVGTAESGESINTFISGGSHHQMILNKVAGVKDAGRFAGVIFHQGESDCGAADWPGKVVQLYDEVKTAWGVNYDVPFILGEIPAGNADCANKHNPKIHEAAEQLPMGYWISQEGTSIFDQYHFDHESVVLMGTRYGEKMIEVLGW